MTRRKTYQKSFSAMPGIGSRVAYRDGLGNIVTGVVTRHGPVFITEKPATNPVQYAGVLDVFVKADGDNYAVAVHYRQCQKV